MNYNNLDVETLKVLLEREIELYNERAVVYGKEQIDIYEVRNALNSMYDKQEVINFIEELNKA